MFSDDSTVLALHRPPMAIATLLRIENYEVKHVNIVPTHNYTIFGVGHTFFKPF